MGRQHIDYIGPHTLDMSSVQGRLVDIEKGGMQGLRPDKPGFPQMALELAAAMPLHGAAAGVPQDVYDHLTMCNDTVDLIDGLLTIAVKQVEVLIESRAFYVDARQNDVSLIVDAMRSRAQRRKDPSLLVPFETVLRYYSQLANRSAQTRKKNAQAKLEAAAETGAPSPPADPVIPA